MMIAIVSVRFFDRWLASSQRYLPLQWNLTSINEAPRPDVKMPRTGMLCCTLYMSLACMVITGVRFVIDRNEELLGPDAYFSP
jgi:hypothetical protein